MISLVRVSKIFPNKVIALKDISLTVGRGEFAFIVGPSGAGKTTLLRLLYREDTATSGRVVVDGQNVGRLTHAMVPFLRRKIGVVFQDFKLLPDRNVFDNVAFAMEVVEAPRQAIQRRVPWVLKLVGLDERARSYPEQLSGGEQQRAALARAIVNGPALLLADEPTGNLDPETAWGIIQLLADINRRGTTVLVATHARSIVDAMKKRVIQLDHGFLVRDQEAGGYAVDD